MAQVVNAQKFQVLRYTERENIEQYAAGILKLCYQFVRARNGTKRARINSSAVIKKVVRSKVAIRISISSQKMLIYDVLIYNRYNR